MGRSETRRSAELRTVYERVIAGAPVRRRHVDVGAGRRVHVLETGGDGPPLVLRHGTTASAGMFLPLLAELQGIRAVAPDRPGHGLSDPIDFPRQRLREMAVAWVDHLLDGLELDSAALLGHSGGGLWALWYALAHPERVDRLLLLAPPALPRTRCPLPLRLIATPGLGALVALVSPPSPKSVLQFARSMGEQETLAAHPDLIDLFVAAGRDPIADRAGRSELRAIASPLALLTRSGFRRSARVPPDQLRQVIPPTLVVWGDREPLGAVPVARDVAELISHTRLEVLPAGHAPWRGHPARTAALVAAFVR